MKRLSIIFGIFLLSLILIGQFPMLAAEYGEAPELKEQVEKGELPPIEERLPVEPKVFNNDSIFFRYCDTEPEIGDYGGEIRMPTDKEIIENQNPYSEPFSDFFQWFNDKLFVRSPGHVVGYDEYDPIILKGWDFSNDGKEVTIFLREGIKWSDGQPHTVDDWIFTVENVRMNEELPLTAPNDAKSQWEYGGERLILEKIDDYTLKITSSVNLEENNFLGNTLYNLTLIPKHFFAEYTPGVKPNPDATDEEFDNAGTWPDIPPTLGPYVIQELSDTEVIAERNPYYWEIDEDGNQLPYLDRIIYEFVDGQEMLMLKFISGELDYYARGGGFTDPDALYANKERGGYEVLALDPISNRLLQFNLLHEDDNFYELFRDARFRRAMQFAIDMDAIGEAVYGPSERWEVSQNVVVKEVAPEDAYYEDFEYDPEKAEELLSEIGLEDKNGDGYLQFEDGSTVDFVLDVDNTILGESIIRMAEFIRKMWEDVGIKVTLNVKDWAVLVDNIRDDNATIHGPQDAGNFDAFISARAYTRLLHDLNVLAQPGKFFPLPGKYRNRTWVDHPDRYGYIFAKELVDKWEEEGRTWPPEGYYLSEEMKIGELIEEYQRTDDREEEKKILTELVTLWSETTPEIRIPEKSGEVVYDKDLGNMPESTLYNMYLQHVAHLFYKD